MIWCGNAADGDGEIDNDGRDTNKQATTDSISVTWSGLFSARHHCLS